MSHFYSGAHDWMMNNSLFLEWFNARYFDTIVSWFAIAVLGYLAYWTARYMAKNL